MSPTTKRPPAGFVRVMVGRCAVLIHDAGTARGNETEATGLVRETLARYDANAAVGRA